MRHFTGPLLVGTVSLVLSCSSATPSASPPAGGASGANGGSGGAGVSTGGATGGADSSSSSGGISVLPLDAGGPPPVDAGKATPCTNSASEDGDQDGFTGAQGDCNDCDPNVNPAAYDVPGNRIDEDCSGKADDEITICDHGAAVDSADAALAAKALGVCRQSDGTSWGLVRAAWVFPDGTTTSLPPNLLDCPRTSPPNPNSHGLLSTFGAELVPRQGQTMVAISSGMARAGNVAVPAPGFGTSPVTGHMCTYSNAPPGFPKDSASCPGVVAAGGMVFDGMALEIGVKVPSNAHALMFDFDFLTTEFPNYVCSRDGFNDQFAALLWSKHPSTPADHNISFDSAGNDVNVNNAFLDVCSPTTVGGRTFQCPLGLGELQGTGITAPAQQGQNGVYIQGGGTSWLTTTASVVPGETITLRLGIWDAGDDQNDSTTLLDRLTWQLTSGQALPPPSKPPVTTRSPKLE